jgi:RNA polymerase sigma factor (sigma-70 family)
VKVSISADLTDKDLVEACLGGDQRAWALLIDRYKNLIYSFPRRYGAGPSDAADVFQLVCTELFTALPRLRNGQSVCAWIMAASAHEAYRWKRRHVKRAQREGEYRESTQQGVDEATPALAMEQDERGRIVRQAIATLPPRCQEMVRLLFFEDPPVPYQSVAQRLGLATGSIGLTRSRCLKRLEGALLQVGLNDDGPTRRLEQRANEAACRDCQAQHVVALTRQAAKDGAGAR